MLGIKTMTWRYFRTQGQQILGDILKNFVSTATWRLGFAHHYSAASKNIYIESDFVQQNPSFVSLLLISDGFYVFSPHISVWILIQVASLSSLQSASEDGAVLIFISL